MIRNPLKGIKNRVEFVALSDIHNGIPNGDPLMENRPRVDRETETGLVSPVSAKRKIRDVAALLMEGKPGYDIYVKIGGTLDDEIEKTCKERGLDIKKAPREEVRKALTNRYVDLRYFGTVGAGTNPVGHITGPIQFGWGRSVDPVTVDPVQITCKSVTKAEAKAEQMGDDNSGYVTGTMGMQYVIPYALYRTSIFYSPFLARVSGFTEEDMNLFVEALYRMYELTRSASRAEMAAQKLYAFEHSSPLGDAPAHKLFDLIRVARKDKEAPARNFSDYSITVNRDDVPEGVTFHEVF